MKRWTAALLATAAVVLTAACGGRERPVAPAEPTVDRSKPVAGGTLNRRLDVDIATLNPVLANTRNDRLVAHYLFTPLVYLDAELRPIPGLAESWDISDDGLEYTFHLNPKATFSDGTPVRASDVLFTLRKIVDPLSEAMQVAAAFDLLDVRRTRIVDDNSIVVAFRERLAAQLGQFTNLLVLPERVYGKGSFRDDYNDSALGSGPYMLVRREPGKEVVIERRKNYWGTEPFIDTVVFKVITNSTTAWNAVRQGEVDETMVPSEIWMRERNDRAVTARIDWRRFYGLSYNALLWNERVPLFADARIRRALSMCLDVRTIINTLYGGTARAMTGHFLPEQMGYNPELPVIAFEPDGAKQVFTSLGWLDTDGDGVIDKGGKAFRFELMIMPGNAAAMVIAQMMQSSLKDIGVQADVTVVDGAVALERLLAGNYQAVYMAWDLDPDPDPLVLFHSSQFPPRGQNVVYYSNPEADRLIDEGRRELNPSKRARIYQKLDAVLAADQPYTWVNQPSMKWALNRRVQGAKEAKGFGLFLWYPGELDWWLLPPNTSRAAAAGRRR